MAHHELKAHNLYYHCTGCNWTLTIKKKEEQICLQCTIEKTPYELKTIAKGE